MRLQSKQQTESLTKKWDRLIRRHKLLKLYDFEESQVKELTGKDTEWEQTFDHLKEVAPVQSWEPILAAPYSAEVEEATAETARLYCQQINTEEAHDPKRHFTDSKVCFAVAETEELFLTERTDHYGRSDARVHSNWEGHQSIDNTSSSHHRNLDKGDRRRTRFTAPQTRATDQNNTIVIIIQKQEVSQRIDKPATSLFRSSWWQHVSDSYNAR